MIGNGKLNPDPHPNDAPARYHIQLVDRKTGRGRVRWASNWTDAINWVEVLGEEKGDWDVRITNEVSGFVHTSMRHGQ